MQKERILLFLGVWIVILPYLGFPHAWKDIFIIISGVGLIFLSLILHRESKSKEKGEVKNFDNFRENNFSAEQEVKGENTVEVK